MGDFKKNERDLKEELSPISYAVTQENATERPHRSSNIGCSTSRVDRHRRNEFSSTPVL